MQIITNWQFRPLLALAEIPTKAQKDFDYLSEDDKYSPRIVHYRGEYIDVFDSQRIEADNGRAHPMGWSMRVHPGSPLAHFDSIISHSYFSGHLFRLGEDDSVMCGRYFS